MFLDGAGHLALRISNSTESAAIWTRDTERFAPPVTVRAWVKFPASYELWHSFWWNNGTGEVDVYENGGLTNRYQAAAHTWSGSTHTSAQNFQCYIPFNPQAAFHLYEARITDTAVTYSFDGTPCTTLSVPSASFAPAGWLNINHWPNNGYAQSGYPSTLLVDRVQVVG